jgi:hypothetical protein
VAHIRARKSESDYPTGHDHGSTNSHIKAPKTSRFPISFGPKIMDHKVLNVIDWFQIVLKSWFFHVGITPSFVKKVLHS